MTLNIKTQEGEALIDVSHQGLVLAELQLELLLEEVLRFLLQLVGACFVAIP